MALPVLILHNAKTKLMAYCSQTMPDDTPRRGQLDIRIDGDNITLMVLPHDYPRHGTKSPQPVARFHFNQGSGTWSLLSPQASTKDDWRIYTTRPERDLGRLIKLLDSDTTGTFWTTQAPAD